MKNFMLARSKKPEIYTRERKHTAATHPGPPSFWRAGQYAYTDMTAPVPRRSGKKLLPNFFSKKLRVQGSVLPPPAQGA